MPGQWAKADDRVALKNIAPRFFDGMIRDEPREKIFDPTRKTVTGGLKNLPDAGALRSCKTSAWALERRLGADRHLSTQQEPRDALARSPGDQQQIPTDWP